jgi:ribosomal protein S21
VLTYSNWEHVTLCFSESFASLSEGFQNAVWALGGVAWWHRTDCMTLAVNQDGNPERFTRNYQGLMDHYGVKAQATNPYSGHENGDCEQAHRQFKRALEQALLVRGSRNFATREEYTAFVQSVVARQNAAVDRGQKVDQCGGQQMGQDGCRARGTCNKVGGVSAKGSAFLPLGLLGSVLFAG